jgi:hypothetical protein
MFAPVTLDLDGERARAGLAYLHDRELGRLPEPADIGSSRCEYIH